jgi:plastocyanin
MSDNRRFLILGAAGFLLLLLVGGLLFSYQKAKTAKIAPLPTPAFMPTEAPVPTLSEEEREIISKMETHTVLLKNSGFSPSTLTIKVHDQVRWSNETAEDFQVKGEGWGNLVLGPGKNYTRDFDKAGTYPYSCVLHPEMSGIIIVEE